VLALATSSLGGCKRHPPAPTPAESVSALALPSSLAPSEEPSPEGESAPTHCKQLPGFALTVDAAAPTKSANPLPLADDAGNQEEDDDTLLPFGVDIGAAVPTTAGFAVAGIRGAGMAFVALLDQHGGRRVDLGELHGDAETPALAAAGDDVIVALRSTDAAGFTLKLARLAATGSDQVQWGFELSKLGKTVTGVELAVTGGRGVLVYQGEAKQGASRLMLGTFSAASLKEPFEVKPVAVKDAEMPRLSPREGGYWLSWVHALPEPKSPGKKPKGEAPADPEEADLLEVGLRVVEVAKLDERGQLLGAALRIGEPRRQVLLYDVAPLASGGLLVAARSDSAAPGAEGGALLLSEVGPDGSVHEERLEDDELGAGAPALFVDSAAKSAGPWLSMSSPTDATRLGLARGGHSVLQADSLLGRAEVIAVGAGHFLVQRARGRDVSLEVLDCAWPSDGPAPNQ
jgi:hypothetical protein